MAKAKEAAAPPSPTAGLDFKALLATPAQEATRPAPLPIGTWRATIKEFAYDRSRRKKTPFVRFSWALVEPGPDIDPNDLEDVKWQGKTLHQDFYITDDALYRINEFFESLGVETSGKTLAELIQESTGLPGLLAIEQKPSDDPESDAVYTEIVSVSQA